MVQLIFSFILLLCFTCNKYTAAKFYHPECTNIYALNNNNQRLFAHKNDCTKYFKCMNGKAYEQSCAQNLHWNREKFLCEQPEEAKCEARYAIHINAKEIKSGALHANCPIDDDYWDPIYLPFVGDCTRFLKCSYGRAYVIKCPVGTYWSDELQRCNYERLVKCIYAKSGVLNEEMNSKERVEENVFDINEILDDPIDSLEESVECTQMCDSFNKAVTKNVNGTMKKEIVIETSTENLLFITDSLFSETEETTNSDIDTTTTATIEQNMGIPTTDIELTNSNTTNQLDKEIVTSEKNDVTNNTENPDVTNSANFVSKIFNVINLETTAQTSISTEDTSSIDNELDNSNTEQTTTNQLQAVNTTPVAEIMTTTDDAIITTSLTKAVATISNINTSNPTKAQPTHRDKQANALPTPKAKPNWYFDSIRPNEQDPRLPYRATQCIGDENRVKFAADNCLQFYQCFEGYAYLLNCHKNYAFSVTHGKCIKIQLTNCKNKFY